MLRREAIYLLAVLALLSVAWLWREGVVKPQARKLALLEEEIGNVEVAARALELAARMAQGPQQALQFIKEAVIRGMNLPLDQGLELERKSFQLLFATCDKSEGIRARLEKRPAKFV